MEEDVKEVQKEVEEVEDDVDRKFVRLVAGHGPMVDTVAQ